MPGPPTVPATRAALDPDTGARVFVALVLWFSLLFGLGVAGMLERPNPLLVPAGLLGAITTLVLARRRSPALRAWVDALDLRVLVGFHIVRAPIGLWFLIAYQRGMLPGELALRAGWGDIAAGVLALVMLPLGLARGRDRALLWGWNAFAMADILLVVLTAQKLVLIDGSAQLAGALGHPFVLLPWFVVPLVILSHVLVFGRLRAAARASG